MRQIDEMEKILGWKPRRGMRLEILKTMKEKGICLGEATSLYQMPLTVVDGNWTGYADFPGEGRILIEDYHKMNPWRKLVIIHRRSRNPKLKDELQTK